MTERLRRALEHIDEVPETIQDDLAEQIEELTTPNIEATPSLVSQAGTLDDTDIDFDHMLEDLDRIRHGQPIAPPVKRQP